MADEDPPPPLFTGHVVVLLIAMGSAAFVVSIYHLISICLCNQHIRDQNPPQQPARLLVEATALPTPNINQSTPSVALHLIPAHKYQKKTRGIKDHHKNDDDEDDTCAVCLGDFEEGEELRALPECKHTFHVPCIDMWLNSHSSCPICRTNATPSPLPAMTAHHSLDVMQIGDDGR